MDLSCAKVSDGSEKESESGDRSQELPSTGTDNGDNESNVDLTEIAEQPERPARADEPDSRVTDDDAVTSAAQHPATPHAKFAVTAARIRSQRMLIKSARKTVTTEPKQEKSKSKKKKSKSKKQPKDDSPSPNDKKRLDFVVTYCLCEQTSYGKMIYCDNDLCPIQWFHFPCVSLKAKPKGKWFCPKCRGERSGVMKARAQFLEELVMYNKEKEDKA